MGFLEAGKGEERGGRVNGVLGGGRREEVFGVVFFGWDGFVRMGMIGCVAVR